MEAAAYGGIGRLGGSTGGRGPTLDAGLAAAAAQGTTYQTPRRRRTEPARRTGTYGTPSVPEVGSRTKAQARPARTRKAALDETHGTNWRLDGRPRPPPQKLELRLDAVPQRLAQPQTGQECKCPATRDQILVEVVRQLLEPHQTRPTRQEGKTPIAQLRLLHVVARLAEVDERT